MWTSSQWACVMFPDGSIFSLLSVSGRTYIYRQSGTRYLEDNIIDRDHFGGAGLLFFCGIILGSRTDLHVQIGPMKGQSYWQIFLEQLVCLGVTWEPQSEDISRME
ncbi:transposable element Tcb1 transposase [Nephila pilipes]|uniref:Transposable element Tcb1 transposase n=1 Tax=Nephila pilipes TaxID=299642 RepID=A0A8X6Q620_NEPPI|nr:transposable element Tcb1 transposase [Nephila pilipes]